MSVASSVSAVDKTKFSIPDSWPPSIMACIRQSTEEEQRRALGPLVRNEIVRVLATQMFCYDPKPQKEFCTAVAKKLVKRYCFMKDTGEKVSGYVSVMCVDIMGMCMGAFMFAYSSMQRTGVLKTDIISCMP